MSSHPWRFEFGSIVVARNGNYNRNMHQGQNNQRWKEPQGSDQPFRQQHLPQYHRQRPSYNACQNNCYGGPFRNNQHPPNCYSQEPFRGAYQDDRYGGPPSYTYDLPPQYSFEPPYSQAPYKQTPPDDPNPYPPQL